MNPIFRLLWILYFHPPKIIDTYNPEVIAAQTVKKTTYVSPVYSDGLELVVNNERKSQGLSELRDNKILDATAHWKACDMVSKGYWAHQDPQGNWSWGHVWRAGYHYYHLGENIARNYSSDQAIVTAWFNSPEHRQVMNDPSYRDIGIGRCGNIVVMHLGVK